MGQTYLGPVTLWRHRAGMYPILEASDLSRDVSVVDQAVKGSERCFWACFFDARTVYRAVKVSLLVGPVIGLINHFDVLLGGELTMARLAKIGVTFLVPFCVSAYSSATTMMAEASKRVEPTQQTELAVVVPAQEEERRHHGSR